MCLVNLKIELTLPQKVLEKYAGNLFFFTVSITRFSMSNKTSSERVFRIFFSNSEVSYCFELYQNVLMSNKVKSRNVIIVLDNN